MPFFELVVDDSVLPAGGRTPRADNNLVSMPRLCCSQHTGLMQLFDSDVASSDTRKFPLMSSGQQRVLPVDLLGLSEGLVQNDTVEACSQELLTFVLVLLDNSDAVHAYPDHLIVDK